MFERYYIAEVNADDGETYEIYFGANFGEDLIRCAELESLDRLIKFVSVENLEEVEK